MYCTNEFIAKKSKFIKDYIIDIDKKKLLYIHIPKEISSNPEVLKNTMRHMKTFGKDDIKVLEFKCDTETEEGLVYTYTVLIKDLVKMKFYEKENDEMQYQQIEFKGVGQ